ncbi:hypothetical protein [Agromyces archimandritae]|uniref:Uncharacterized protein n=1 Tax=Agromyces archimandritae TaxID=2781962 RepID=A0A975IR28_9MICO|nr:hypothetical protein [Agromyces archimandritae]QTX05661.1 hypothetical protein G127AT_05500 [Agromyces archimandritae]
MSDILKSIASIRTAGVIDGLRVLVADSVAFGTTEHVGTIVVCGSHGGRSAGEYARRYGYAALLTSDAGIGRNDAGIAGLRDLDEVDVPGVGISHVSARIGDGDDVWENGVVSYANRCASLCGVLLGQTTQEAVTAIAAGIRTRKVDA